MIVCRNILLLIVNEILKTYLSYNLIIDNIDNNWLAVPIIVDFRTFKFNTTTFDNCIQKGYDLHYPPVNTYIYK